MSSHTDLHQLNRSIAKLGHMSVVQKIDDLIAEDESHRAGTFPSHVLKRLEELMPAKMKSTAETGCGKSTILFSNISSHHTVFCINDKKETDSSINFFKNCPLTDLKKIEMVLGPTQDTLPRYRKFRTYDAVLIDGPHGYPFPEIEYYYFYPHLKKGSLLILDDVHIATIGRLADFINEDPMFDFVELVSTTAVFRRTEAPTFNAFGDGWWEQDYNRRRIPAHNKYQNKFRLSDGKMKQSFAELILSDLNAQQVERKEPKSLLNRLLRI